MYRQDDNLIKNSANNIDLLPSAESFDGGTKPWWHLVRMYAGIILDWKHEEVQKEADSITRKMPVWFESVKEILLAISRKDVQALSEPIKHHIQSHKREWRSHDDRPKALISIALTALLILAIKKGLDLSEINPPYVSMEYVLLGK